MPTHFKRWLCVCWIFFLAACGGGGEQRDGRVVAPAWTQTVSGGQNLAQFTRYANGIFFVQSTGGLMALAESNGQLLWQTPASGFRLSDDQLTVYASLADQTCVMFDARGGARLATMPPERMYLCDPLTSSDSGSNLRILFDENNNQTVVAYRPDGSVAWRTPAGLTDSSDYQQPPGYHLPLPQYDGIALLYTLGSRAKVNGSYLNLQAFALSNGALRWQARAYVGNNYGVIVHDHLLLASYPDGAVEDPSQPPTAPLQLHALDLATGALQWSTSWLSGDYQFLSNDSLYTCADRRWKWIKAQTGQTLGENASAPSSYWCSVPANHGIVLSGATLVQSQRRVSKGHELDAGFKSVPYDTWATAYDLQSGDVLWSSDYAIEDQLTLTVAGQQMILMWWPTGEYHAYKLRP